MKKLVCSALLAASLGFLTALADQPLVTITLKDFSSFSQGVDTLFDAVSPGSGREALRELGAGLGITSLEGVDEARPWQIALWLESPGNTPCASLRVPVDDYAAFAAAYRTRGGSRVATKAGDYAKIWLAGGDESDAARSAHDSWQPGQLKAGSHTVFVEVTPGEPVRQLMLQMLGMGRMSMAMGLSAGAGGEVPGMDMQAMVKMMGVYFDVFEVGVKGLKSLNVGLDVSDDSLRIQERIEPLPDSELAAWFENSPGDLAGAMPFLSANAPVAVALRLGNSPAFLPKLKELATLSMQMQKAPNEAQVSQEMGAMLDAMAPMTFAGSLELDQGIEFTGLYQFPKPEAARTAYGIMRKFLAGTMQTQVGDDRLYKRVDFVEGQREVQGTRIDRVTMEINLDSPLYQMPGQREMVETMWGGGKMEFDYALRGRNLVVSSPVKTVAALRSAEAGNGGTVAGISGNTVMFARLNLLKLIPWFVNPNPVFPEEVKAVMGRLEASGTDVTIRADLDGALATETHIPVKLLRSIGNALGQE